MFVCGPNRKKQNLLTSSLLLYLAHAFCGFCLFTLTMACRMMAEILVRNEYTPIEHTLIDTSIDVITSKC